jgi:YbbR domain-containing protein
MEIDAGYHRLVLNADNIELPLGLEVVRITPSAIRLEMEERIEKQIAVEPKIAGKPPAGYQIEKIRVRPGSLRVSGPVSKLRDMLSLSTESITVSDIEPQKGEKVVEVPVVLSPASLRLLPGEKKMVVVTIHLKVKQPPSNPPPKDAP